MIYRKIGKNRNIILFKNNYYVVDDYSKDLLSQYEKTNDINEISKTLKIPAEVLTEDYKKISDGIKNFEYYDNNINLSSPLKIQWKITPLCNLKCAHCYLGEPTEKPLSKEDNMKIADNIINSNVMEVTITGGEALTVSYLDEIVNKLINNNIKVKIFTNGILLGNFIDKINKDYLKNITFSISVDGMKEAHEKTRGENTFNPTIEAIKKVKQLGCKVITNTVLTKLNYKDVGILFKLLSDMNIDYIQFSNLIVKGRATNDLEIGKSEQEYIISELKKYASNTKTKLYYAKLPDEENQVLNLSSNEFLGENTWKCSAGVGKGTIGFDGNMYCCPFIKNSCIGNVVDKKIKDVWKNNSRYEFLKRLAINNKNHLTCSVRHEGEF